MTEQLKTLMDRAADLDFAAVDIDAITGAGDRTVRRRRRVATGVAGITALAAITTTAVLLGDDGTTRTDFVDNPSITDVPLWTEQTTLHTPTGAVDLGVEVVSFARTSAGIVLMGLEDDDELGVYAFTGAGDPVRIGTADDPHLRSDPDDPYVGWLDKDGKDYEAVIFDQSTGERVWAEPARAEYSFPIVAIDDRRALLADADEGPTRLLDIETGQVADLSDPSRYEYFLDIEGELVATLLESRGGRDLGFKVSRLGSDEPDVEIRAEDAGPAVFSPGGRWISVAGEDIDVVEVATGAAVDIGALDDRQGFGYEWVDGDTLMVLAEAPDDNDVLVLMSCEIPRGTCEDLARLEDFERLVSIGTSDLLWGLMRGEGEMSSGDPDMVMEATVTAPAPTESSSTERPE